VFDGQAGSPESVGAWRGTLDRYAR